jgi:hypothetical protein
MAILCAFALTLTMLPLAQANDMRTRAQTAADSAAIGAVTSLRDQAVSLAQQGFMPTGIGLWMIEPNINAEDPAYNQAARKYAERNRANLVDKVHVSGTLGYTMKASVQTDDCQLKREDQLTAKEKDDLAHGRNLCTDNQGRKGIPKGRGTATSIATLKMPDCAYRYRVVQPPAPESGNSVPVALTCGGKTVWEEGKTYSRGEILRVFKIRLVAKEDSAKYTGLPMLLNVNWDSADLGDLPGNLPALVRQILAFALSKVGMPYVWGGESDAEGGYDCSGLLWAAYHAAGISIPRTADLQYWFGVPVPKGSEQPGDFVFWHMGSTGPGHVAMVVDPVKKLAVEAHCTTCGPIRVNSYAGRGEIGFTRPLARFGQGSSAA